LTPKGFYKKEEKESEVSNYAMDEAEYVFSAERHSQCNYYTQADTKELEFQFKQIQINPLN
jgi:hypothetical protein